jgi:2-oxoacid:acceptor oxidoreductase delta subunit (pyruvate/2-ketoisovalerate family)
VTLPFTLEDVPDVPVASRLTDEVSTAGWRTLRPEVHDDKCTGCTACWKFCPDVAITLDDRGHPTVSLAHCKGCGICAAVCRPQAIAMVQEEG